jgi:hypothetical protein
MFGPKCWKGDNFYVESCCVIYWSFINCIDYVALDAGEYSNGKFKEWGRKCSRPMWTYRYSICLERLKKIAINIIQRSWSLWDTTSFGFEKWIITVDHPVLPVYRKYNLLCGSPDFLRVSVLKDFTCRKIIVRVCLSMRIYTLYAQRTQKEISLGFCSFVHSHSPPRDRHWAKI